MPRQLTCDSGHSVELSDRPARSYVCSKCGAKLAYFAGPRAWQKWQLHNLASGRVRAANTETAR